MRDIVGEQARPRRERESPAQEATLVRQEIAYTLRSDRTVAVPNFGDSEIVGVDFFSGGVAVKFKLTNAHGDEFAVAVSIVGMQHFSLKTTFWQNVIESVKIFDCQADALLHGNELTRHTVQAFVDRQERMTRSFVPPTRYMVLEVNSVVDTDLVCMGSKIGMTSGDLAR